MYCRWKQGWKGTLHSLVTFLKGSRVMESLGQDILWISTKVQHNTLCHCLWVYTNHFRDLWWRIRRKILLACGRKRSLLPLSEPGSHVEVILKDQNSPKWLLGVIKSCKVAHRLADKNPPCLFIPVSQSVFISISHLYLFYYLSKALHSECIKINVSQPYW